MCKHQVFNLKDTKRKCIKNLPVIRGLTSVISMQDDKDKAEFWGQVWTKREKYIWKQAVWQMTIIVDSYGA